MTGFPTYPCASYQQINGSKLNLFQFKRLTDWVHMNFQVALPNRGKDSNENEHYDSETKM